MTLLSANQNAYIFRANDNIGYRILFYNPLRIYSALVSFYSRISPVWIVLKERSCSNQTMPHMALQTATGVPSRGCSRSPKHLLTGLS